MITASTSLWYLYALIVYFVLCKLFARWTKPLFAVFVVLSVTINFLPTPWWGMNSVIRNLPWYSLGAWFGASLMAGIKQTPLRRHPVAMLTLTVAAVAAWLANIALLLSFVSIVLIMKAFYQFGQRYDMRSSGLLSSIGVNTIAIYTTHRILVEAFSLSLTPKLNHASWSPQIELILLLTYPFLSLLLCTLAGLAVRSVSQNLFADLFSPFSPDRHTLVSVSFSPLYGGESFANE